MIDRSYEPSVAALAGRRIDPQDADYVRFPFSESENVFYSLLRRFRQECIERLVCSAACGADIIALEAAEKLAIPALVVLPYAPNIFRQISVIDRPGNWGERFDHLVKTALARDDLIQLDFETGYDNAFSETNSWIIKSALNSQFKRKLAFVVWEGKPRGKNDSTAEFLSIALSKGFEKRSVLTIRRK